MADDSNDDHKTEGEDDGLLASSLPSPTKLDVSNFQCPHPDCGRSYASKHGLDNHNRVHFTDNEKPFACPHPGCLSRYTNKRGVTRHFNLKHKDKSDWFNCPTAECDSSFFDERQLKLHQREHGLFRCTARHCAYEYTTEQELYDHRERNHTTSDLYEDRTSKRPPGMSKIEEDLPAQASSGKETGDEIVVDENSTIPEFCEDEDNFENSSPFKTPTHGRGSKRGITKRASLNAEDYPARPNCKGWKCPKPGCTVCRKVQFDIITHWQEAHSDIPEPAHFEFVHGPKSSENTATPRFGVNGHRLGGQSTSVGQPAHPDQEGASRSNANDGARGLNSQQQRGKGENTTGNKNTNMNGLSVPNAATSTPFIASSRLPAATNTQGRTPRSNNGHPIIPPPRHAPNLARPTTTVLANSTGNLSGPAETPSINNRRKKATVGHPTQRVHARATEASRMSPPPARSNQGAKSAVALINTRLPPQRHSQVSSPDSSRRASPVSSDEEEEGEEEGLFVSPPDTTKNQTKGPRRVLGVRGFANMPLPRDQDSDEEDLRPSHVLRQERRAAAGKFVKLDHAQEFLGASRKIYGQPRKMGKSTKFFAARSTDSDDDSNFEGSDMNSSGSSFGETETHRPGRRSTNHVNARASNSVPRRSSVNNGDPPRTPSPDLSRYQPYEVYGPDLDSPPPSYLIKSPGVIDRTLPYPSRPEDKMLPDVAVVQPDDLFDADDIFFSFRDMTPHEREVQDRLDAEKEAMRANAYGSGFRAPLHFDHCPLTAPICRAERAAWIAERLRLDVEEARGDESEDPETPSRMDRDDDRRSDVDVEMTGTGTSALSKKKRATCSGPVREKRKYNWRDPARKNKRRKGSFSGITSRRDSTRRSYSGGNSQIDGADEQEEVVAESQKPKWAWSDAHRAVINTRKPVELVRPDALATEGGTALPRLVDRAPVSPSVGSDNLDASGVFTAAAGSANASFVSSDG